MIENLVAILNSEVGLSTEEIADVLGLLLFGSDIHDFQIIIHLLQILKHL